MHLYCDFTIAKVPILWLPITISMNIIVKTPTVALAHLITVKPKHRFSSKFSFMEDFARFQWYDLGSDNDYDDDDRMRWHPFHLVIAPSFAWAPVRSQCIRESSQSKRMDGFRAKWAKVIFRQVSCRWCVQISFTHSPILVIIAGMANVMRANGQNTDGGMR